MLVARDWNITPEKALDSWDMGGTCIRTYTATECHGSELDWIMQANSMPKGKLQVHEGQPYVGHLALEYVLPRNTDWDLGQSRRRPQKI